MTMTLSLPALHSLDDLLAELLDPAASDVCDCLVCDGTMRRDHESGDLACEVCGSVLEVGFGRGVVFGHEDALAA